ncbi:MAG: HAD family phosphatase [Pyrinomonadaceae bacterium]|nr:HAD family phosphatase [Pyrinomonadaceae bacterium]
MALSIEVDEALKLFLGRSRFAESGGVITDLDGTAVHEDEGRVYVPPPVAFGLKALYDGGRRVVLNSLRFPLSMMRTFGKEWLAISNAPIPVVSMNGSQLGYITTDEAGELSFDEIAAFPLSHGEIKDVLLGVEKLLEDGIRDILLFYYPRDWRMGEIIWTPVAEKVIHVKEKFTSASSVTAVELEKLREQLLSEEICMIFLLIERPADDLMAYQHSRPSSFYTHKGVDKLYGAEKIAQELGFELSQSVGAGDTPMDSFLNGVGLMVQVGNMNLEQRGLDTTIKLQTSFELGDLLFRLTELQQEIQPDGNQQKTGE